MKTSHFENCNAPLCKEGIDQQEAVWHIGEEVCKKQPYTDWQKKQLLLNKKLKLGYKLDLEMPFNLRLLKGTT